MVNFETCFDCYKEKNLIKYVNIFKKVLEKLVGFRISLIKYNANQNYYETWKKL